VVSTPSDHTILFRIKLRELRRHLAHAQDTCATRAVATHPNMAARLRQRLSGITELDQRVVSLEQRLALYKTAPVPAQDTWRQLCKDLTSLSAAVQWLRTKELPAYLAATSDDQFVSNLVQALHSEIGLADVHPVVSLHQTHWFAVYPTPPAYPLYFAPASIATDPSELPLILHEIGHVLFELWGPVFNDRIQSSVAAALARKRQGLDASADPKFRADGTAALAEWESQAYDELEEVVCDVVGALLGGPAFVVALTVGLLAESTTPFTRSGPRYPPLDCRMRLGDLVLHHRGLASGALMAVADGWERMRELYATGRPRWYTTLYDDDYLSAIVVVVEDYLQGKGVHLYDASCTGLRRDMTDGATALLSGPGAHRSWNNAWIAVLRRDYASSSHPSSSSSSSTSSA